VTDVLTTTLLIAAGMATRYDPGLMKQAYENHLRWGHITECPECLGQVALLDCSWLDERVWLHVDGIWLGPVHVTDCAAAHDQDRLKKRRWAVDLSWHLARWLNVIDDIRRGFEVWRSPPMPMGEIGL